MNIRISYVVSLIEILLISFPATIFSPLVYAENSSGVIPSRLPDASPTSNGKCDNTCTQVDAQTSDEAMEAACPKNDPGSPSPVPIENNGLQFQDRDQCISYKRAEWGEVYTHCRAKKLNEIGRNYDIASASVFTAASAACLTACVMLSTGVGAGYAKIAEAACTIGGIAGEAVDVAGMVHLSIEGQSGGEWINESFGFAALGPGALGIAAAGGSNVLANNGYQKTKKLEKAAAKKAAQELGEKAATEAAKEAGEKASLKTAQKAGNTKAAGAMACVASFLFLATGALKFGGVALHEINRQNECKKVEELDAIGQGTPIITTSLNIPQNLQVDAGSAGGQASGGKTGKSGSSGPTVDSLLSGNNGEFPSGQLAAATAGAGGQLFNNMPNKDKIPDVLDQLGTSLSQIGKQLAAGESPSSIVSNTVPNLDQNTKDQLAKLDQLAREGKITSDDIPGLAPYSSGGKAKDSSSNKENPLLAAMKNRFSMGAPATTQQVSFEKKEADRTPSSTGDDIWHSNWNGTIFQLISTKIDRNRGRVEQMEWTTPLNRALTGLPKVNEPQNTQGSK